MDGRPVGMVLRPDDAVLARWPDLYGHDPGTRVRSLAEALVASQPWGRLSGRACLVVRGGTTPVLAVVGHVRADDRPLLDALGAQVADSLERLRPVSYADAEQLCAVLAERLLQRMGPERVRAASFVGVPRGGHIVLGMLAYTLRLAHQQLDARTTDGRELVVVDDCMLSGARTRRWLAGHAGPPVTLAHLHSHPELRRLAEADPRIEACIAAADLHDTAPERQGGGYLPWRQEWGRRSPDDYWTGHPEHVCYPWNEPDTSIWNPGTGQGEAGWLVVPPRWSLKNRAQGSTAEVQVCVSDAVPPAVLWARLDDSVVLVHADRHDSLELRGSAADFWLALVEHGAGLAATAALVDEYDVDPGVVRTDLEGFVRTLTASGWWDDAGWPEDGGR